MLWEIASSSEDNYEYDLIKGNKLNQLYESNLKIYDGIQLLNKLMKI